MITYQGQDGYSTWVFKDKEGNTIGLPEFNRMVSLEERPRDFGGTIKRFPDFMRKNKEWWMK